MNEIHARIQVGPDHRISGTAPAEVPPGEHEVTISLQPPSAKPFRLADLPLHDAPGDAPWDGSIWLRREDLYVDDER